MIIFLGLDILLVMEIIILELDSIVYIDYYKYQFLKMSIVLLIIFYYSNLFFKLTSIIYIIYIDF